MKWYNVAKNSTTPHSSEVMSQLQAEFLWKLNQIPDNMDFNDPKTQEDLKKWYYWIVNFIDKTKVFTDQLPWWRSFTIDNKWFTNESNFIATNIAEQQLQIFNKCKSLKFGLFGKKEHKIINPDWSIFIIIQ